MKQTHYVRVGTLKYSPDYPFFTAYEITAANKDDAQREAERRFLSDFLDNEVGHILESQSLIIIK